MIPILAGRRSRNGSYTRAQSAVQGTEANFVRAHFNSERSCYIPSALSGGNTGKTERGCIISSMLFRTLGSIPMGEEDAT